MGNGSRGIVVDDGGIFNFYDGIISVGNYTNSNPIEGTVTNLPIGYSIKNELKDDRKIAYLVAN